MSNFLQRLKALFTSVDKKRLISLIIIVSVAITIPLLLYLAQRQQDLRQRASEGQAVSFLLDPATITVTTPGQTIPAALSLNAGSNNITAIDIIITVDPSVATMESFQPSSVFSDPLINKIDPIQGTLRYVVVNPSSKTITGNITLGTLTFKGKANGSATATIQSGKVTAAGQSALVPLVGNQLLQSTGSQGQKTPTPPSSTPTSSPITSDISTPINNNIPSQTITVNTCDTEAGQINGIVYFDTNKNGEYDELSDYVFPGVTIDVKNASGVILQTTVSTGRGKYCFKNLPLHIVYIVTERPREGTTITEPQNNQYGIELTSDDHTVVERNFGNTGSFPLFGIQFQVTLALGGIGSGVIENSDPVTKEKQVIFEITDMSGTNHSSFGILTFDNVSKTFKGTVGMGINLAPGNYRAKVKVEKYLRRFVPGIITIGSEESNIILPKVSLIAGDITPDNSINIFDYNIYLTCYGEENTDSAFTYRTSWRTDFTCKNADLNDDGRIDSRSSEKDYRILLNSFSTREGD